MIMAYFILQVKNPFRTQSFFSLLLNYANTFSSVLDEIILFLAHMGNIADRRGSWWEVVLLHYNHDIQDPFRSSLSSPVCSVSVKPKSKGNSYRLLFKEANAPIAEGLGTVTLVSRCSVENSLEMRILRIQSFMVEGFWR